ncbi:serine--tRNA ligase [Candidatus Dojkabacteria bacterium]|nr:serine--tRNA ligase [Candidatus Dojkabacteria bacterium]
MIDIKRIVDDIQKVRDGLLKRVTEKDLNLDEILNMYEKYKKVLSAYEAKRAEQKKYNEKMASIKDKSSDGFKKSVKDLKVLSDEVKKFEVQLNETKDKLDEMVAGLPNVPEEDIVAGGKENNEVIREWGEKRDFGFKVKDHTEVGEKLGILDFKRASKISGAQMPMYVGDGAVLEWALIDYFMKFHRKDGYVCIIPPHLLNEESAYVAGQLPKFKDDVYWTQDSQCLLPTAETALCNLHRDEVLDKADLPLKYFAYTPCYRREAGSYGKDERGLIRMHQFDKVEMFHYTTKEKSAGEFNDLVARAEKLVQGLGLTHRVSKLAAEDMSFGMARTYDVEVWLPYLDKWTEVSSISNAHDFQSRRGNVRYKDAEGKMEYTHTLNASGLATSRLMAALIETYQNEDGSLTVPEVLRDYVGKEKIEAS